MLVTVEVINEGALTLLSDMEGLDLIRINSLVKDTVPDRGKLSDRFVGTLRLSDAKYEAYQNAIKEGRSEWSRDIY
jgi:hypothetical protein